MADHRIKEIKLDERTIMWRNADVEQERRIAIFDLLEDNSFAPQRDYPDGYAGPYLLNLGVEEGRLVLQLAREDGTPLETLILSLGTLRRPIKDYFAICDSYYDAIEFRLADLPFPDGWTALPSSVTPLSVVTGGLMALVLALLGKEFWEALALENGSLRRDPVLGRPALLPVAASG